jgi:diacylglycerol kinase (ATP)
VTGPFGSMTVIVEAPAASAVPLVEEALAERGFEAGIAVARSSGDASRIAHEVIASGGRFVVAVGGDDVVHDVVNGMFAQPDHAEPPVLGVIPAGIDNEFFRQFGLPMDVEKAAGHLAGDAVYPIDVGVLDCADGSGEPRSAFVANVVEAGLGARMAPWTSGQPRGRTFLRFWAGVMGAKSSSVHVEAARQRYDGRAWSVVVGNGKFGAGGFRVSPRSFPGDGVLEVLVHHGPRSAAFTSLPKAYKGEQVPSPHIAELRGNRVRIEAEPPMPIAVDGRPFGRTPATVEVRAQALFLKI